MMKSAMTNPFAVSSEVAGQRGVFGDHARLRRSAFLFRVIDFERPFAGTLVYSGWWFRQKVEIAGEVVWFRISWLTIERRAEFRIPVGVDPSRPKGRLEIDFTRGLRIRRFRVWIEGQIAYDEIN
jgi:hypothetical protein